MNVSAHESAEQTEHTLLSSRGCQAATAGVGNKIITHEGKTHVAWLESRDGGQTFTAKPIINPDPNKGEVSQYRAADRIQPGRLLSGPALHQQRHIPEME